MLPKYYLTIDPGKINIGIVICKNLGTQLGVAFTERVAYKNDKYFISRLREYLDFITSDDTLLSEISVAIERQYTSSSISANMRFVAGYLTALGCVVNLRSAITHKLNIKSYSERKNYSVALAMERLSIGTVHNADILLDAMTDDSRKHDLADAFNLAYNEWQQYSVTHSKQSRSR